MQHPLIVTRNHSAADPFYTYTSRLFLPLVPYLVTAVMYHCPHFSLTTRGPFLTPTILRCLRSFVDKKVTCVCC